MWIGSASNIYISLIYFENVVILQSYFMILSYFILFYFILFSRSFYFIPYMDLRPWIAILSMESYLRNLIGYHQEGETAWPPTEFSPS